MIRRRRKPHLVAEINITPFTDVILVLLVIFMVITPLLSQANIPVNLPEAGSFHANKNDRQANITITKDGHIFLEEKAVSGKELKEAIESLHKQNPDLSVLVRADRLACFKNIVEVIDPLVSVGITKLNIAATTQSEQ